MSGYLTIHYMTELQELGIQYLRKPFHLENIYKRVNACQSRIDS